MSKNIKTPAADYLFDAILSLKDKDECYDFFDDICYHISDKTNLKGDY